MTSNTPANHSSRFRNVLDLLATLAIVIAAAAIVGSSYQPNRSKQPGASGTIPLPADPVSFDGAPVLGRSDAPIVIIEFSDFECSFCGLFARETLPQLKSRYIDTGHLQLAFRHLPFERRHLRARSAAEAAECAAQQGRFWQMHDRLFGKPASLLDSDLEAHAKVIGLALPQFSACWQGRGANRIADDLQLAKLLKITGTPTFLIGPRGEAGLVTVRYVIRGAQPIEQFESVLKALSASLGLV